MAGLSIIIVSYNVRQLLLDCLKSITDTCRQIGHEVIVVDNNSADGTVDVLRKTYSRINVIANSENAGFARANNQGYAASSGEYLLLLNPDTVIRPGAVKTVLDFMERTPDCGLAGCRLAGGAGKLQKSVRRFPSVAENLLQAVFLDRLFYRHNWKRTYYAKEPFPIDYCAGAFMMVRRAALGGMPPLNEEFFMYAEEKDLCLRLRRKGWKTYFVPGAEITHLGGKSTEQDYGRMFSELHVSQVKYFKANYSPAHAWLMTLSWGLVILANVIYSLPLALLGRTRRLKAFAEACRMYPGLLKYMG